MLILGAEFIAMLLVIVYVGAVAVLLLFIVLMLDIGFAALRSGFTKNLPFGLIVALVLLAEIVFAVSAWKVGLVAGVVQPAAETQANTEAIAELLYTRFLFPFEIAGLILLVAMIGAIVLTHRSRADARGQNVARQVDRRPEDAVKLEQPQVGEGVKL